MRGFVWHGSKQQILGLASIRQSLKENSNRNFPPLTPIGPSKVGPRKNDGENRSLSFLERKSLRGRPSMYHSVGGDFRQNGSVNNQRLMAAPSKTYLSSKQNFIRTRRTSPHDRRKLTRHRTFVKVREKKRKQAVFKNLVDAVTNRTPFRFQLMNLSGLLERSSGSQKGIDSKTVTFSDLGVNDVLMGALDTHHWTRPTEIQRLGIPLILKNKEVFLAAETGSGKTLTYLIPLVQMMKETENSMKYSLTATCPRAIVLVPSRELVLQVLRVAKKLGKEIQYRCEAILPSTSQMEFTEMRKRETDLLITTPSQFLLLFDNGMMNLERLRYVVLDEADTLLDAEFGKDIRSIFSKTLAKLSLRSLVVSTATITRPTWKLVKDLFPKITMALTSDVHKPSDVIRQRFFHVNKTGDAKQRMCMELLLSEPSSNIMVFCNSRSSATNLFDRVYEQIPTATLLHGNLPDTSRDGVIQKFLTGASRVLVCTDLASRGLDTLPVNHVVLYDFPRNSVDYLHRVGRTGRAGRGGRVTSFITRKDEKLFKFIQSSIFRHLPLGDASLRS